MLRVVIADDSYLVREALTHLLDSDPRVDLVATCEDGAQLAETVAAEEPDVVVTDIRMPPSGDAEGVMFANRLRVSHPRIGVVVVSQYADPRYGLALLDKGSDGRAYLLKDRLRDREHLLAAIFEVAAGGSVVDAKVVEALITARGGRPERAARGADARASSRSSARWRKGESNQAIAEELFLSKRAVEKHINAIFMKLGPRPPGRRQPTRQGGADLPRRRRYGRRLTGRVTAHPGASASRPSTRACATASERERTSSLR